MIVLKAKVVSLFNCYHCLYSLGPGYLAHVLARDRFSDLVVLTG